MDIVVVATPERATKASRLVSALAASVVMDGGHRGALHGHREALRLLGRAGGVVMEDDAVPVLGFRERAETWQRRFPNRLISFYLGTGQQKWQRHIDAAVAAADAEHRDYVELPELLHGVAYLLPPHTAPVLLENLSDTDREADYAIGAAWARAFGHHVIYPTSSLVDHDDGGFSVEAHPDGLPRNYPRHARRLAT